TSGWCRSGGGSGGGVGVLAWGLMFPALLTPGLGAGKKDAPKNLFLPTPGSIVDFLAEGGRIIPRNIFYAALFAAPVAGKTPSAGSKVARACQVVVSSNKSSSGGQICLWEDLARVSGRSIKCHTSLVPSQGADKRPGR